MTDKAAQKEAKHVLTITWGKALSSDPDGWLCVWRGVAVPHPHFPDSWVLAAEDLVGKWDTDGVAQISVEVEPPFTIRAMGRATCQWFSMTVLPDDVVDGHVHIRPNCELYPKGAGFCPSCGDCALCDEADEPDSILD